MVERDASVPLLVYVPRELRQRLKVEAALADTTMTRFIGQILSHSFVVAAEREAMEREPVV